MHQCQPTKCGTRFPRDCPRKHRPMRWLRRLLKLLEANHRRIDCKHQQGIHQVCMRSDICQSFAPAAPGWKSRPRPLSARHHTRSGSEAIFRGHCVYRPEGRSPHSLANALSPSTTLQREVPDQHARRGSTADMDPSTGITHHEHCTHESECEINNGIGLIPDPASTGSSRKDPAGITRRGAR